MREHMYRHIEQAVANIPDPDRFSVRAYVTLCISELRRIDAA
jgi:hypothetical protein